MVLDDAKVGMDVATDKQIVRFRLDAVVVMQHKEELLLIDSLGYGGLGWLLVSSFLSV